MSQCLICNFKGRLGPHLIAKHNLSGLEYASKHYNIDTIKLYENGHSANQICAIIKEETNFSIKPVKKDIYVLLKNNGIQIRNTSSAIKFWSQKNNGPWNKGQTKETNLSIKKQSEKITGKNNSFYKTAQEKRIDTYFQRISKDKEQEIRRNIGIIKRKKYKSGDLISFYQKLSDNEKKIHVNKILEGQKKWRNESVIINKFISNPEKHLNNLIKKIGYDTTQQYYIKNAGSVDIFIKSENLVIEFNGDYWHANPKKYKFDFFNPSKKMFSWEIWEKDHLKQTEIERQGFHFSVLWESDYKIMTDDEILLWVNNEINKNH